MLYSHRFVSNVGSDVLSGYLGLQASAKEERQVRAPLEIEEVSVILQIIGQLTGQVICSMTMSTVKQLVGRMNGGEKPTLSCQ